MKIIFCFSSRIVITGCGDSIVRCFDARSGSIKRMLKSHTLAVTCMQVEHFVFPYYLFFFMYWIGCG